MKKLILFSLIIFFVQCKKHSIPSPHGYAIGVINFYNSSAFWALTYTSRAEINYNFFVNGKEFGNQYSNRQGGKEWKIPPHGSYNKGDQYMIQYNISDPGSNPQSSRMLFDYPVPDSTTYKNDVAYFQTHPPQ
jgi:hypothetical protein